MKTEEVVFISSILLCGLFWFLITMVVNNGI